jgi:hypothetical protein
LFFNVSRADHDDFTLGGDTVNDKEDVCWTRLEDVCVGWHLSDVEGDVVLIFIFDVGGFKLKVSLTKVHLYISHFLLHHEGKTYTVGRETRSNDHNLGIGGISRLVERSVGQGKSITTVRQGSRESVGKSRSSLVVPFRVPSLDDIACTPLGSGDVLVGVGT